MRGFNSKHAMIAAIIVGFEARGIVVTDDDDKIQVGDAWIAQRMPKVGDAIYKANGQWALMTANKLDNFEVPEPVGQPEPEPEPEPEEAWVATNGDAYLTQDSEGYGSSPEQEDAMVYQSEAWVESHVAEAGEGFENFKPVMLDNDDE